MIEGAPAYAGTRALLDAGKCIDVFLDGKPLKQVQTADEEQGIIVKAKEDAQGNIYCVEGSDEIAKEVLTGKVEIKVI